MYIKRTLTMMILSILFIFGMTGVANADYPPSQSIPSVTAMPVPGYAAPLPPKKEHLAYTGAPIITLVLLGCGFIVLGTSSVIAARERKA